MIALGQSTLCVSASIIVTYWILLDGSTMSQCTLRQQIDDSVYISLQQVLKTALEDVLQLFLNPLFLSIGHSISLSPVLAVELPIWLSRNRM